MPLKLKSKSTYIIGFIVILCVITLLISSGDANKDIPKPVISNKDIPKPVISNEINTTNIPEDSVDNVKMNIKQLSGNVNPNGGDPQKSRWSSSVAFADTSDSGCVIYDNMDITTSPRTFNQEISNKKLSTSQLFTHMSNQQDYV